MKIKYEWDPEKAVANLRKHSLSFEFAVTAFDGFYVDDVDRSMDYGETRYFAIGLAGGFEVYIVFTENEDNGVRRIISARRANARERLKFWTAARYER
jgi:uncharacterized protein